MKPNPNSETLAQMLRVDHAGEYGANRIYEGQLMVLKNSKIAPVLEHMLAQEQAHLKKFNELLAANQVRPSVLMPLWHLAGLALGIGSALLGEKAAMAATVAVEEAIDEHYQSQEDIIENQGLKAIVQKFRLEELEHRDTGLKHNAEAIFGYKFFNRLIKTGAQLSIFLAKRF